MGCLENIRAFLAGTPQNVVNPDVLKRWSAMLEP
jgi:hypothetical protein